MGTAELVISAFAAAGIGTIVGHMLATAKDRREARAHVLKTIAKVESARWAPASSLEELQVLIHEAAAAMLVARVPRWAARRYLVLAHAAGKISEFRHETTDEGTVPGEIADATANAARAVTAFAWHPWLGWADVYRAGPVDTRPVDSKTFSQLRINNPEIAEALDVALRSNRV